MVAPRTLTDTPVPTPDDLRGAHRSVRDTREGLKGLKSGPDGRIEALRRGGRFGLRVSRAQTRRALLVLHALTAEALRRGMSVQAIPRGEDRSAGVGIGAHGHVTCLEINEATDRVRMSVEEQAEWKRVHHWRLSDGATPPTHKPVAAGRLEIVLPRRWDRENADGRGWQQRWSDGSRAPLEAKLDSVLRALRARADADVVLANERARADEQRRREAIERQAREQRDRIEQARGERLIAEAAAWRRAAELRAYVAAMRARLDGLEPHESDRLRAWIAWAEDYVERTDPITYPELIRGLDDDRDRYWYPQR